MGLCDIAMLLMSILEGILTLGQHEVILNLSLNDWLPIYRIYIKIIIHDYGCRMIYIVSYHINIVIYVRFHFFDDL